MNGVIIQVKLAVLGLIAGTIIQGQAAVSQWVRPGFDGTLLYKSAPDGSKMLDFSTAGYMGGGVALPQVTVRAIVHPSGTEDDTALIQKAVNEVSALPMEEGFRGAVLLAPGEFVCSNAIFISTDGVVLRGSGSGEDGTTIRMVGKQHRALMIGRDTRRAYERPMDDEEPAPETDAPTNAVFTAAHTMVTDRYVPAGATMFTVADATGFAVGDTVSIHHPTTTNWVKFMGMNDLVRNGRHQTWLGTGRGGLQERKIIAITGNKVVVDMPLADSYAAKYLNPPGISVAKVRPEQRVTQVGIEHLHIQCVPLEISYTRAPYSAIRVGGDDCWVRDVYCEETMNSTVLAGKRITMEGVSVQHTFPNLGASKPTDFSIEGSQVLIDRCQITGDNMYFVWTTSLQPGPNVILNSTFRGRGSRIQPHMRWSTGLLVDNCTVPDGGIDFANRGVAGSGHGWTMGWGVAWNCLAKFYTIQNPPGAINWAVGCIGDRLKAARYFDSEPVLPEGIIDSPGVPVVPQSLYLAQMKARLGADALPAIGYAANAVNEFTNKAVARLPEFPMDANKILGTNLALFHPVNFSDVKDNLRKFSGEKAVDGDANTYWAVNDHAKVVTLEIDLEGPVDLNTVSLEEAVGMTGRVQSYKIEGQVDSEWKLLSQGTVIGDRKVDRFPKATIWKVRLTVLKWNESPGIRELGLYFDENDPGAKKAAD